MVVRLVAHQVGALSKSGVLDVGLKCFHSCEFCYYSYLDGSDDQFRGMRQAPFRPLAECKAALDFFAARGLERLDVTGGEPLSHPDIVELVRYAEKQKNLRVRLITLGQLFDQKDRAGGKRLLDALLDDAGLTEVLLSLHAAEPALYREITKGAFEKAEKAMDELDARGFEYCTNTVVYARNAAHLPELARYLVSRKRRVHIANFITMNAYYAWATGKAFGVQARYSELLGPLREAVRALEDAGIGVNVRYGPYCAQKGLEKNLVGITGVEFDPYEWRNSARNPFFMDAADARGAYEAKRSELAAYGKVFPAKCEGCAVRPICDGVDAEYLARFGDAELSPYAGAPIEDVVHFRRGNPKVFLQKQKFDGERALTPSSRESSRWSWFRFAVKNLREELGSGRAARLARDPRALLSAARVVFNALTRVLVG